MSCPLPERSDDVTIYLVLNDYGKLGSAYVETDPAEADRETIIRNFLSGQYGNAVRVVAFNTPASPRARAGAVAANPCRRTPEGRTPTASIRGSVPAMQRVEDSDAVGAGDHSLAAGPGTAKKTKAFVRSLNGRLRLFYLPPHSPASQVSPPDRRAQRVCSRS
jgi:hypothetical protein